jgi:hypothetical protein
LIHTQTGVILRQDVFDLFPPHAMVFFAGNKGRNRQIKTAEMVGKRAPEHGVCKPLPGGFLRLPALREERSLYRVH